METLYFLYDDYCPLSRWLKDWANGRRAFVNMVFTRANTPEADRIAPGISGDSKAVADLVAVSDQGEVYRGDSAWVMAFYATEEFREWSIRIAEPSLKPLVKKAFTALAQHRTWGRNWLTMTDRELRNELDPIKVPEFVIPASGLQKVHQMVAGLEPRETNLGR